MPDRVGLFRDSAFATVPGASISLSQAWLIARGSAENFNFGALGDSAFQYSDLAHCVPNYRKNSEIRQVRWLSISQFQPVFDWFFSYRALEFPGLSEQRLVNKLQGFSLIPGLAWIVQRVATLVVFTQKTIRKFQ
ncbi:MAG: hypothetical protein K8R21_00170 [Leptospira sp.]|nr:hypothetical protein [Leptospira sp.]